MEGTIESGIPWLPAKRKRYVFRNANLVDPVAGVVRPNVTVAMSDGAFEDAEHISGKADSETVELDLGGRYVCPGLIDCHVHLQYVPGSKTLGQMKKLPEEVRALRSPHLCGKMLERGFTTVRDCGGSSVNLKNAIKEGVVKGPRLFIAGHQLSQTGGHGDLRDESDSSLCCAGDVFGPGRICDGVADCMRIARDELRRGADFIKILGSGGISSSTDALTMVQFSPEEIQAMVSVAKQSGTYVTSHAYTPASIRNAIDNGAMGIEHGNFLDEETARTMAAKGVFLTPTLTTYEIMNTPPFSNFLPEESKRKNEEVIKAGQDSLRIADKAGVTMCYGSDLLASMIQFQTYEFVLRSKVLSAAKVLQAATVNGAKMLRHEGSLGQIKPGYLADMLILNVNPLEDITVLDRPNKHLMAVLKEGRVVVSRWSKLPEERGELAQIE
ncbi:uncharacterized protein HMPREF1541_03057 [Cyphellophora europaea CBS 101466]|uniref:Amidohydrolase-related domain-containing protein n=1 Tax=Cyphellophora europaea (strain CBS 101466) TaxID=1220924 RepID=W2RXE5_CYPE1|nr:uncharacterized protein HMPREF1541_03057 [Cyphellophora europaea CBS 101466]ETN41122.1 hypothetical protein HMPREF1541_03057 [Cyphellophora europaea CBS 101466]